MNELRGGEKLKMTLSEDTGVLPKEKAETESEMAKARDVEIALVETGHQVHEYTNGVTVGLRLAGVPGKRGVHADIAYQETMVDSGHNRLSKCCSFLSII